MKIEPVAMSIIFYWFCLCNHIFVVSGLCLDNQWPLLLQFKNSLTIMESKLSNNRLKSWNPSHDCCTWMGVTCNKEGHVIGLDLSEEGISGGFDNSSSLFSLQHLMHLNLATNNFSSVIPSGFNKLKNLTYLDLSYAGFVGQIPIEISQLTRLVTLDLSSLSYLTGKEMKLENPNLGKLVQNLSSIRQLYLDGVIITAEGQEWINALLPLRDLQNLSMSHCNLSGTLDASLIRLENLSVIILDQNNFSSPVPETFANFKNLTTLSLVFCGLTGRFPQKIFQMETLSVIDISYNYNLLGFLPDFLPNGSLQTIRISNTSFSGPLPNSIGNLRHLSEFDLSYCQFNGKLPNSLSNLTELNYLDLSYNRFTGPMPSFGGAKKLTHLDISHNGLSGKIPSSSHFEGLLNLVTIKLQYNSFRGSIPSSLFTLPLQLTIQLSFNQFSQLDEFINVSSSLLKTLDLSGNNLSGPFPKFIFQLSALSTLKLSSNKFNGAMQLSALLELKYLTTLDISYNNLSVNIEGMVPNWIWKLQNLQSLNISHNLLTDLEGPLLNLTSNLIVLDVHNNQLLGPIPVFPKYASYLDYSGNKFSSVIPKDIGEYMYFTIFLSLSNNYLHGSIPDSLCNAPYLQVLDLSINNISGTIPSCLMTMTETLGVLNLRMNNLTGPIPDMFPASCALRTLDLQKNNFYGQIPKSLANCLALEVLDLAKNQIIDGFPCLLKTISTLRIVDLAFNNFSGELPGRSFTRWEAMMSAENQAESEVNHIRFEVLQFGKVYYLDSVTVSSKGQQMELVKILTVFTSMDFSSNHFQGEIPKQLFDFKALYMLNLSNNAFSGEIPSSIGNLKQLESLDLSQNSLGGEIPVQLGSLTFLSYLNLSNNHLVGKIPTGTQLQSFQASSFEGNDGLYGPPLDDERSDTKNQGLPPQPASCKRLACSIDWNFISAELGFVFGLGIVIGPILFWKQWRVWYWQLVDKILCWIFPQLYLEHVTHRGQRYTVLRWWH
ncbi:Leucine-rich repeat [Sesbania bispinosa]|nr:Leucine-rich repeat [Sesbania bispinosa]